MILQALKAKLRQRGPLGFAADAAELAIACAVIGLETFAIAGAAATVAVAAVVSSPALALELLTRPRPPSDVPSSTDDFAAEQTSCRNAEEPPVAPPPVVEPPHEFECSVSDCEARQKQRPSCTCVHCGRPRSEHEDAS